MTTTGSEDLSLDELAQVLRRHLRRMLLVSALVGLLAGAYGVARPRTWRSTTAFMPQLDRKELSGLSGLAAQFGVQVPGGDPASSPAFYRQLLQSREVLEAAVAGPYEVQDDDGVVRGSLVELLEVRGRTPELRTERAVEALRKRLGVAVSVETGIIRLNVDMPWPTLSRDVAARLVGLVQEFNRDRRAGQARAEREFTEARLREAGRELREAENELRAFQGRNRDYRNSPALALEADRQQREIGRRQQVYNGLSQSFEQARIEEVRNTPLVAVVESAGLPARPRPRGATLLALTGFLTAFAALGAWHFVAEIVRPRWRARGGASVAIAA